MNTPSNAIHESALGAQATPTATMSATRHFYWSVRRELWENRSIYIAPLAVAAVMLVGFLIASIGRAMSLSEPAQRVAVLSEPNDFAALLIMGTTFVVGIFYCLDALHGERRDRSILFWKSLPVSDLTTVLSKASIPLVVLPLLTFAIIVVTQLIMLLLGSAVLQGSGLSITTHMSFFQMSGGSPRTTLLPCMRSGTRPSTAGYCWFLVGHGAQHFSGPACRCSRSPLSRESYSVLHTSWHCSNTAFPVHRLTRSRATTRCIRWQHSVWRGFSITPGLWIGLALAALFLAATAPAASLSRANLETVADGRDAEKKNTAKKNGAKKDEKGNAMTTYPVGESQRRAG